MRKESFRWRNFWIEQKKYKQLSLGLIIIYIGVFYLFLMAFYWLIYIFTFFINYDNGHPLLWYPYSIKATLLLTGISLFVYFYYYFTKDRKMKNFMKSISAEYPDRNDLYHLKTLKIFEEAKIASGLKGVDLRIIPVGTYNALSVSIGKKHSVLLTEGLVSILNADELRAVISHELSHIVNKDTDFITSLVSFALFFYDIMESSSQNAEKRSRRRKQRYGYSTRYKKEAEEEVGNIIIVLLSAVAYFIMMILIMFINRNREYLADMVAIQYTRDPFSLVSALEKIREKNKTDISHADITVFSPLCFVPLISGANENEGFWANLFASHPPLSKRIQYAKETITTGYQESPVQYEEKYYVKIGEKKDGPFTLETIESRTDFPKNAVVMLEDTVIAPINAFISVSAGDYRCPKCEQLSMVKKHYEGVPVHVCVNCGGMVIREKYVRKILIREKVIFNKEEKSGSKIELKALRKEKARFVGKKLETERKCAKCGEPMYRTVFSYFYPIDIEKCDKCKLIFFDRGEIETMQAAKEK